MKKGAEIIGATCRLSNPEEESKGIDGLIGDIPVSIKPTTYGTKDSYPEEISAKMIFYTKIEDGIEVDYSEIMKKGT